MTPEDQLKSLPSPCQPTRLISARQVLRESRGSVYEKCSGKLLCILDPNGGRGGNQRSRDVSRDRLRMFAEMIHSLLEEHLTLSLFLKCLFLAACDLVHECCDHCIHLTDRYTLPSECFAVYQVCLSSSSGTIPSEMPTTLTGKLL